VVVRERERGTFELLAASPVSSRELVVGKLLPYLTLSVVDVVMAVAVGWLIFGVVPQGNLLLLFAVCFLFVLTACSTGLFFSCAAKSQQTAMLLATLVTVVPAMVLSGFGFPVRNMPLILQGIAQLMPVTHFITIARAIILKGTGLLPVWKQTLALVVLTAMWMRAAINRFQKTL